MWGIRTLLTLWRVRELEVLRNKNFSVTNALNQITLHSIKLCKIQVWSTGPILLIYHLSRCHAFASYPLQNVCIFPGVRCLKLEIIFVSISPRCLGFSFGWVTHVIKKKIDSLHYAAHINATNIFFYSTPLEKNSNFPLVVQHLICRL